MAETAITGNKTKHYIYLDVVRIVAVITAAVYAMLDEEKKDGSGFVVRHIRRVNHAPAWQRAGRDEQIYSHY